MRALLERSRSARLAVVFAAACAVLPIAHAASARDEFGFRLEAMWPETHPTPAAAAVPAPAPHRRARRIWAAARSRPLRIALEQHRISWNRLRDPDPMKLLPIPSRSEFAQGESALARRRPPPRLADGRRRAPVRTARLGSWPEPQVVFPKLIVLPKPPRPALVSIYQDRTLRDGDAVMMADGIHVFRRSGAWPHRPGDFVRLPTATAMDWQLRQTLDALDRNPPIRWSAVESTAG